MKIQTMDINNNLKEISAEMLLNYFYPNLEEEWVAHCDGIFYRNYNRDVLDMNADEKFVILARDSFLRLLPEGLLFDENELKGKDFSESYKAQEARKRVLHAAFLPIDTFSFRQRLKMERQASATLEKKLQYVLTTYFGFDIDKEQNPYVREMAHLLPFIREWRADFQRLAQLLGELFHHECKLIMSRYSDDDNRRSWIPGVEFQLQVAHLNADSFRQLYADTRPLEQFLIEWFIPAEMHFSLSIRQPAASQTPGQQQLLNYNVELKQ